MDEQAVNTVLTWIEWIVVNHIWEILTGAGALVLGTGFGHLRAKRKWRKQQFTDRINISLNTVTGEENDCLGIRTLKEDDLGDVFLNRQATDIVSKAAARTVPGEPVLPLAENDRWYLLNFVLNVLSEQFAQGHLDKDMGRPVITHRYLVCLTCEKEGGVRVQKVRAMVMRKDRLLDSALEELELEKPHHQTRRETLRTMRELYNLDKSHFLEVELSTPAGAD